jgi:hypothetical protein
MKDFLKEKVQELYENGYDFYDLVYELFGEDNVDNWPYVVVDDVDDDEVVEKEPLDMENFEWLSLDDNELVVCCCGDWQSPMKLTIQSDGDGLVVVDTEDIPEMEDGMSEDEFNKVLGVEY